MTIEGIECRHCATRIRDELLENKAVLGAEADSEEGVVDGLFEQTRLTLDDLADVIASAADHPGRSYRVTW
ncbi:MAG: heavy-metal-associated domain-containing protein [Gemmatimonadetes bacterium]|nr:heavy-metal-associated domain-containing protein [Gemmatimonadota bacterium]